MRKELNEKDFDVVAGGKYAINNQDTLFFSTRSDSFQLQKSRYGAMEVMDGLIGKYATEEEYDQACIDALRKDGYIL